MKFVKLLLSLLIAATALCATAQQHNVARIERLPRVPDKYIQHDWKEATKNYTRFVLVSSDANPDNFYPLSHVGESGINYPGIKPWYIDTYVGWNAHTRGSEAINAIPAVVSAYLNDADQFYYDGNLADLVVNFFNSRNGQNVYLNGFSSTSGSDWWYDLMPNVYFYQLYHLAPFSNAALADEQYRSVADRWLDAVYALGGRSYDWKTPSMDYRAFNLATMTPNASGVHEPESAGTIAYLLFDAWLTTGEQRYLTGAQLAMEYLSSLGNNPSYELQLPYGVQTAAKMNAMIGSDYRVTKLFDDCFNRGPLRGWGMVVGRWGDYYMSGLIGEANDEGDDYVFAMNGFQQAAALAPAVRYDKRLARAYARWMVNLNNASRYFFPRVLPEENSESTTYHIAIGGLSYIPYEAIKQKWEGKTPFATGDAVRCGWAETNLSLYSGSSMGYLSAVVNYSNVPGILALDLTATDLDGKEKYPTYLYYNPFDKDMTIKIDLGAEGRQVYDAISEKFLTTNCAGEMEIPILADQTLMLTIFPSSVSVRTEDRRLIAGDVVIDWHKGYDFDKRLRIKNVEPQDPFPVIGSSVRVRANVDGAPSTVSYSWEVDGSRCFGYNYEVDIPASTFTVGEHTVTVTATSGGQTATASTKVNVLATPINKPEVTSLTVDAATPAAPGSKVTARCTLAEENEYTTVRWNVSDGTTEVSSDGKTITWILPAGKEGAFRVECVASNVKGTSSKSATVLARTLGETSVTTLAWFPFDGTVADEVSGTELIAPSGAPQYTADHSGNPGKALKFDGNYLRYPTNDASVAPDEGISLAFWLAPSVVPTSEMFIVSHGSWQNRYKVSITPDKKVRWTVNTTGGIVDVDCLSPIDVDKWHHYVAVFTGYSAEIYCDGGFQAYVPVSGTLGHTSYPITIGAMNTDDLAYNLHGSLDELRIYNRALAPAQVRELYETGTLGVGIAAADDIALYAADGILSVSNPQARILSVSNIAGQLLNPSARLPRGIYIVVVKLHNDTFIKKIRI